jgi:hypothetical protein
MWCLGKSTNRDECRRMATASLNGRIAPVPAVTRTNGNDNTQCCGRRNRWLMLIALILLSCSAGCSERRYRPADWQSPRPKVASAQNRDQGMASASQSTLPRRTNGGSTTLPQRQRMGGGGSTLPQRPRMGSGSTLPQRERLESGTTLPMRERLSSGSTLPQRNRSGLDTTLPQRPGLNRSSTLPQRK